MLSSQMMALEVDPAWGKEVVKVSKGNSHYKIQCKDADQEFSRRDISINIELEQCPQPPGSNA